MRTSSYSSPPHSTSSKCDYLGFSRLNRYKIDREAVLSYETIREVEHGQGRDGKSDSQRAFCSRSGFCLRLDARPFCCNSGRIRFTRILFPIPPSPCNVARIRRLGLFHRQTSTFLSSKAFVVASCSLCFLGFFGAWACSLQPETFQGVLPFACLCVTALCRASLLISCLKALAGLPSSTAF